MNRVNIPAWAIDLGKSRSGLCALTPEKTALIVVDLQNAFLAPGETLENPHARDIVPNVNAIAQALRARGGQAVFLRHTVSDQPRYKLTEWQARMVPRSADGDFQLRAGLRWTSIDSVLFCRIRPIWMRPCGSGESIH
jgi:hypothetical protein